MVRADLPAGHQATQAAHAAFAFSYHHRPLLREWFEDSNYLVLLQVPDENDLLALAARFRDACIPFVPIREPDFDDSLTALAIAPSLKSEKMLSRLPLLLKEPQMV